MKNPLSAWAATAQSDILHGKNVGELQFGEFRVDIVQSHNSLWAICEWPGGGRVAFRPVFTWGAVIETSDVKQTSPDQVDIRISCALGEFRCTITFAESMQFPTFRYTTSFISKEDLFVPFSPRDVLPLPGTGLISNSKGEIHVSQEGTRSGHLYFSLSKPFEGSVFYFQNLTALSEYCDATETSVGGSVGGSWPETGFSLPPTVKKPIPAGRRFIISDAFVLPSVEVPKSKEAGCRNYLDYLASVYLLLPKPETVYNDWPKIAKKGLSDLGRNKGCWTQAEGHSYLNAYVCDYDTPPEIMVQLAVLVPLTEYFEWRGGKPDAVRDDLRNGLPAFYDEKLKVVRRWLPSLVHRLDESEEQKKEGVMDSWYLHHPLMNLARLAIKKDKMAEKIILDSIAFPMKVAKHFNYEWPVFYNLDTLDVVKAETAEGKGGEKDVPGAYAHLMLEMRDLTGDDLYFREAITSLKKLEGLGFEIFYQANNTAFSAATLLRVYKETGEQKYLDLSYACIACLFRNMQIWEGHYGLSKNYSRFLSVYPLAEAPYIAAYEEVEVYAALVFYLQEAESIDLAPSVRLLVAEFIRYFVFRMPFYYPTVLPQEVLSDEVKTGEIDKDLWIPLEDLRDGWEKSGQVGQEVYGAAGAGFGVMPRQYHKLGDSGMMLFCDYPVHGLRIYQDGQVTFRVQGDKRLTCRIRIIGESLSDIRLSANKNELASKSDGKDWREFEANGETTYRLEWSRSNKAKTKNGQPKSRRPKHSS
ncbi:hypothetical protein [Flavobacterium selenitireducens]|uniref:hypothetical protein n=1 Tax=Flavobacterium selenitireducens TaxID=2722704 RepID=UPI00168A4D6E|nr:hypothetical protein [Flavobacterium selenitireducens]MBD3582205.1 hypothetical protein [Flavobacterium selenitireducens]